MLSDERFCLELYIWDWSPVIGIKAINRVLDKLEQGIERGRQHVEVGREGVAGKGDLEEMAAR